jgi:tetratricopeptide (TPR) repeat protein
VTQCILFPLEVSAQRQEEETFFKANQAFKQGHYLEAIKGYQRLIEKGYENGHLHFNLGNAYLRLDQLGRAILHYERAKRFMPRDPDLKFNLNYALDRTVDALPQSRGLLRAGFFWIDSLTFGELFWGFAVVNVLFWGILTIRLFIRPEWTYYLMIIFLISWLTSGLSVGIKWVVLATDNRAVILTREADILAGPQAKDTVLFKLHEGAMVQQERSEDGWVLIRFADDKRGWVRNQIIEKIRVHS